MMKGGPLIDLFSEEKYHLKSLLPAIMNYLITPCRIDSIAGYDTKIDSKQIKWNDLGPQPHGKNAGRFVDHDERYPNNAASAYVSQRRLVVGN